MTALPVQDQCLQADLVSLDSRLCQPTCGRPSCSRCSRSARPQAWLTCSSDLVETQCQDIEVSWYGPSVGCAAHTQVVGQMQRPAGGAQGGQQPGVNLIPGLQALLAQHASSAPLQYASKHSRTCEWLDSWIPSSLLLKGLASSLAPDGPLQPSTN